ncbi:MAG: peptide deformylase [Cytophagales bacterium]|nr:peptide deformylase [Cytophagales bacterium]
MIYPILLFGDPVLKRKAQTIEQGELDIEQVISDLFETMDEANGVGLAAPQIGMSIRLFILDTTPMVEDDQEEGTRKVFINPEILEESGEEWAFEEGCLSVPGIREDVVRLDTIKIKYQDEEWNWHEEVLEGMAARVIQHEYDHLEGKLFTDYLTSFKKRILKTRLANISKGKVDVDYRYKAPLKK